MRTFLRSLLIFLLAPAAVALAQDSPPTAVVASQTSPLSAHVRLMYRALKAILLRSAEKMPDEAFGFKPTDAVRTFGEILGHLADTQYSFCSIVLGEANPAPKFDQMADGTCSCSLRSKAEFVAALKDAFAYCDKAYDGMTDAAATQTVKLFGGDTPTLGVLTTNNLHTVEHYGNLVTYMRMKNIVPPTSEPGFAEKMK